MVTRSRRTKKLLLPKREDSHPEVNELMYLSKVRNEHWKDIKGCFARSIKVGKKEEFDCIILGMNQGHTLAFIVGDIDGNQWVREIKELIFDKESIKSLPDMLKKSLKVF